MGKRNDEFRKKYNELDKLCREKYSMWRTKDGKRNNYSAIRVFASKMPQRQKESLFNICSLRNLIEHNDCAEVNYNVIKELDMFIAIVKKEYSINSSKDFNLISYIKKCEKDIIQIKKRFLEDELDDVSPETAAAIGRRILSYIDRVKKAKDINHAKSIMDDLRHHLDNIENDPIITSSETNKAKKEAISEINITLHESLNKLSDSYKIKVKDIAKRYIQQINNSKDEDEISDLADDAIEAIEEITENNLSPDSSEVKEAKRDAISDINDSLNDALDELKNPFKKIKAKDIANRYIKQIQKSNNLDEIDSLSENAVDAINDLTY